MLRRVLDAATLYTDELDARLPVPGGSRGRLAEISGNSGKSRYNQSA